MQRRATIIFTLSALILSPQARAQSPSAGAQPTAPTSSTAIQATALAAETAPAAGSETGVVSAAKPVVLSFVEWKSLRVHEAQQKLEQIAAAQVNKQGQPADEKSVEQKLNFNVDVALQLNIQDYFSMYLKNLSKEEFKEATKKMNQDEVSDLLMAYKTSQDTAKGPSLKFSKSEKR